MKCFVLTIIDDQGLDTGYGRFLKLLFKNQYLKTDDFELIQEDYYSMCLGFNKHFNSLSFQIYTHNYGDAGIKISFCEALEDFRSRKEEFDFYVFDLNFIEQDGNSFYPKHPDNTCEVSKLFEEQLPLQDVTKNRKSTYIAGLEFYHLLEPSPKPKIIYSAADQTATLRSSLKLFNSRLSDTFIVSVIAPEDVSKHSDDPFAKSNDDVLRAFDAIDKYLQSRQIEIINRQSPEKIKALSDIVTSWSKNSVPKADEPLIPDDGENDDNKENCWSLRTLFPKQVNKIELGLNESESKRYILNVINNFNFRDIVFWLLHEHGNADGLTRDELPELNVRNRLNALKEVDFTIIASKAAGYKRFSDISEVRKFFNEPIENVKKSIEQQLRNVVIKEFDSLDFCFEYGNDKAKNINNDVLKWLSEFGLYIGDVAYIKSIAHENQKHCQATDVSTKINITGSGKNKILTVEFIFATEKRDFNDSINSVQSKIKSFFKNERFLGKPTLEDQGIGDLLEIIVKRYKADGKIQLGNKSIGMDAEATLINETDTQVKYILTIKSKKS